MQQWVEQIAQRMLTRHWMLATAESCTGGWVAQELTALAGSSGWFDAGFVTYSNAAKTRMLGVAPELIEQEGAVSEAVVRAMAEGARRQSGGQLAVSISGIAGPGGGSELKPVGTVWFGWACEGLPTEAQCHLLAGDRAAVRRQAVEIALRGLLKQLEKA
ncbi:damage-inducible protein CinA [Marinobacterium aestuarii]|uniref:Damage-inducible protein CinA n=1 Tax=Marinobacterium aestuarii TaxID=1821621 RepID=A0A1A9EVI4_9GAMM|nr:CinA family protein [Marinobacterium aestuarii]ANG61549.1 damage-inducible protein CinA [Marinobacterium aestuarii]